MEGLNHLWAVAEKAAGGSGESPLDIFGDIGLFLERPLRNIGYDTTPINSLSFASTGGDGVHYGLVFVDGEVRDNSPVVMTVPCNGPDETNYILGENLYEFLCLGCQIGYFGLEQLVYQRKETLALLENPEPVCDREEELLSLLRNQLDLVPWENVESRLEELRYKFRDGLEVQPGLEWE